MTAGRKIHILLTCCTTMHATRMHRLGPFGRLGAAPHWTTAPSDEVKKSKKFTENLLATY